MYHVGVIHGSSFGAHFPVNNFKYNLSEHGFNAKYESFTMAPEGVTLFGTMPWLKGKVDEFFACSTWIRPTMNIFGRHDLIQPWVALPMGPNRTQITIYTQLPTEYFDTPGFKEKNQVYADFIRLVAEEDRGMMESLHNAANSRAFTPGPTVKLERAIHHLLNFWLDTLFEENPEAAAVRRADGAKALAQQSDNAAAAS